MNITSKITSQTVADLVKAMVEDQWSFKQFCAVNDLSVREGKELYIALVKDESVASHIKDFIVQHKVRERALAERKIAKECHHYPSKRGEDNSLFNKEVFKQLYDEFSKRPDCALTEFAKYKGMDYNMLRKGFHRYCNWTPNGVRKYSEEFILELFYEYESKKDEVTILEFAKEKGVNYQTLYKRFRNLGMMKTGRRRPLAPIIKKIAREGITIREYFAGSNQSVRMYNMLKADKRLGGLWAKEFKIGMEERKKALHISESEDPSQYSKGDFSLATAESMKKKAPDPVNYGTGRHWIPVMEEPKKKSFLRRFIKKILGC
jgi:hypothetical protein